MSKKIKIEEIKERLKGLEDIDHHIVDLSNYKNFTVDKVNVSDKRCGHTYKVTLKNFCRGTRCPICSRNEVSNKLKINEENLKVNPNLEVIEYNGMNIEGAYKCVNCGRMHHITHKMSLSNKFRCTCSVPKVEKHNKNLDKYDDILKDFNLTIERDYFKSTVKPAIFKCTKCGNTHVGYYNNIVVNGSSPCTKCSKNVRYRTENFERYYKILNEKGLTIDGEITKVNKKYNFRHSECGESFTKQLSDILYNDQGCPKCAIKNRCILNEDDARNKLSESFNLEIHGEYINTTVESDLKCKKCGLIFKDKIRNVFMRKDKYGCPSCSCFLNKSMGETKILEYLRKRGISFSLQKTFENMVHKSNLKYDFFLDEYNLAIEFNGVQHYEPVEYFGGEKYLMELKEKDEIKIRYAHENKINLLIIKYTEINEIEKIIDGKLYELKDSRTVWVRGKE